ncbi:MAG: hypothetical protein QNJ35_04440 [Paracoccaceae bacterium]|nr:hypothetical protein [Paracoccaceae bacterium]
MSFIRPEVQASIWRWREVIGGAALLAAGLWLATYGIGPRFWFGTIVAAFGVGLIFAGIPRGRFRGQGGGAGVVDVDERRITYFGPVEGGSMALADIQRLCAVPPRVWELTSVGSEALRIPMDAEGADQLFDTFTALPGMRASALVHAARGAVGEPEIVWEKPRVRLG